MRVAGANGHGSSGVHGCPRAGAYSHYRVCTNYEPRMLTFALVVDDKNFAGARHILNTISQWDIKHAVNAHSPGADPVDLYENVQCYNDLYDAVKAAADDAIAQAGGATFGAYGLYDTLPETLELEQCQD